MAKKKPKKLQKVGETAEVTFDFEESLGKVEGIVSQLESGELGLTASLQKYEQGIHELKECQSLLDAAEQKISQLSGFDADGNPVTTPQPVSVKKAAKASKKSGTDETGSTPESPDAGNSVDDSPGLF